MLTDQELATIIIAARQMPPPHGGIVELLALTGQRRQEVCKLKWDELDEKSRTWSIPASRTKNKKAHIVHSSEPAWRVIAQRPVGTYVFGTSGAKHFFRRIQNQSAHLSTSLALAVALHDLRRTVVSGVGRLGVPPHVADKFLTTKKGRFPVLQPFINGTNF